MDYDAPTNHPMVIPRIQPTVLARLKELLAKLPPPPWTFSPATTNKEPKGGQSYFAAQVWKADQTDLGFYSSEETGNADSTLTVEAIALMRNTLPGLIVELEQGRKLREAMVAKHVKRAVVHGSTGARWGNQHVCDLCGVVAPDAQVMVHVPSCPLA